MQYVLWQKICNNMNFIRQQLKVQSLGYFISTTGSDLHSFGYQWEWEKRQWAAACSRDSSVLHLYSCPEKP